MIKEQVICGVCNKEFNDCFSAETDQAYGCSANVYVDDNEETYVIAHYGSDYDTSRFKVNKESNLLNKNVVICDCCITEALNKNEIVKEESFSYFDTYLG